MRKLATRFLELILGSLLALLVIIVLDRNIERTWGEYGVFIRNELPNNGIVMQLFGDIKRCDMRLFIPPDVQAYAVDNAGNRRTIHHESLDGNEPVTFPCGPVDFGVFLFEDRAKNSRPIIAIEMVIKYNCLTGPCYETLGPFPIDYGA